MANNLLSLQPDTSSPNTTGPLLSLQDDPAYPSNGQSQSSQDTQTVSPGMSLISNALGNSSLGMVAQGSNAIFQGMNNVLNATGLPIPDVLKQGSQEIFKASKAMGIGFAKDMTGSSPQEVSNEIVNAMGQNYQPQDIVQKAGSMIGEIAPLVAAGEISPALGSLGMMAQQAQSGKISPLLSLGLVPKEAIPLIQDQAIKGLSAYFGPSEDAIRAKLNDPTIGSTNSSDLIPQTANDFVGTLNNLQKNIKAIDNQTWNSLLKLQAEPKSSILGMINKVKGDLTVSGTSQTIGQPNTAAYAALDNIADQIKAINTPSSAQKLVLPAGGEVGQAGQFLNQVQLRDILRGARSSINFSDPGATPTNQSMLDFTHYLSDYLKTQNPQYADLIQQSADRMDLLGNVERVFSLDKSKGQFVPSDSTASQIQSVLNPKNIETQQVANQVKNLTGYDLSNAAQRIDYTKQFENTATNGSRRAVIGKAVGGLLGSIVGGGGVSPGGAALGAMAGGYADKYAAQYLGTILDYLNKLGLNKQ